MREETLPIIVLGKFVCFMGLWFLVVWEKADKWVNPTMLHPLFASVAFVFLSVSVLFVPFVEHKKILHVSLHALSFSTFVAPFVWLPRKQKTREELFLPATLHSFLGFVLALTSLLYALAKLFILLVPNKYKKEWMEIFFGLNHKKFGSAMYFLFCICVATGITERQDRAKDDTNAFEVILLNSAALCCLFLGSHYLLKNHRVCTPEIV